jgi:hypothetical protein
MSVVCAALSLPYADHHLRLRLSAGVGFEAAALPRRLLETHIGLVTALPPELASRRWLCPAETGQIIPGYAPGSGLALRIYWAKGRTKGIAQKWKATSTAGHSHRLTSGGKAESRGPNDF